MTLETKRLAKAVIKKLQPLLEKAIAVRPREASGYTLLQGYRSMMGLAVGHCRRLGMSEDEVRAANESTFRGFKQGRQEDEELREVAAQALGHPRDRSKDN